jgi:hypothetical protein
VRDQAACSEFVRAYLASGMTQAEFCALHRPRGGPSERTLRSWLATLTKPAGFTAEARAIVARAVADLQHLLQALDAVEHAQVPDVEEGDEPVHAQPAAGGGRQAARAPALPTVPEPAAGECRPADDRQPDGSPRTLLDDLVMTMQHAKRDHENSATSEEPAAMGAAPEPPRGRSYFSEFT